MRVFFDASVIIAALLSDHGGSSLLLQLVQAKKLIGITSQTVINEILEEDKSQKLKRTKKEIEQFIAQSGVVVRKQLTIQEITLYQDQIDVEDAHLIAGAKLTRCDYLVSLDKRHILRPDIRQKFSPLKIVSPKELIEELLSGK